MSITLEAVTAANWRASLALGVHPEQQRFVAGYVPISAIALAKAYVGAGGNRWSPLLIYDDGVPVGFVALATRPDAPGECWLYHFFIDREQQGRGLGRAAILALLLHIRSLPGPVARARLTVHPENVVAQRLYRAAGFEPTGEEHDDEPVYVARL